jgi:hypothetical protein
MNTDRKRKYFDEDKNEKQKEPEFASQHEKIPIKLLVGQKNSALVKSPPSLLKNENDLWPPFSMVTTQQIIG